MYFITTKRMLEVCFFQHTPTFIIEPYCTNKRYDCAPKAVDQHVRKPPCAARDEELVEFVGAGVEEDDGESGEKTAFHI